MDLASGRVVLSPMAARLFSLSVFCGLFALAAVVYLPGFDILPLHGDNYYALWWANQAHGRDLILVDPAIYPEWRPLAYLTVWAQFRGLGSMGPYFLLNVLLLAACGWLVFRTVMREAGSAFGAAAAVALVLTDQRGASAVTWIIERQSSMACLLGLLAMFVDDRQARRGGDWRVYAPTVTLLLVASMLSKEYGLACAVAIAARAAWERRVPAAAAAGLAVLAYGALRFGIAHGAAQVYCTEGGYFFDRRVVCFDAGTGASRLAVTQMGYNVVASVVGTLLPGLFTGDGMIGISRIRLGAGALTLALACVGWWRGSALVRSTLLVVLANAGLSFLLYRDRNQLIAVYAMALPVGAGASWLIDRVRADRRHQWLLPVAASLLVATVGVQAYRTREVVLEQRTYFLSAAPCAEDAADTRKVDFMMAVTRRYGVPPVACAGS